MPAKQGDPDIFFPRTLAEESEAIAYYCFPCKFKLECEQKGDEVGAEQGIWGGKKRTRRKSVQTVQTVQRSSVPKEIVPVQILPASPRELIPIFWIGGR